MHALYARQREGDTHTLLWYFGTDDAHYKTSDIYRIVWVSVLLCAVICVYVLGVRFWRSSHIAHAHNVHARICVGTHGLWCVGVVYQHTHMHIGLTNGWLNKGQTDFNLSATKL